MTTRNLTAAVGSYMSEAQIGLRILAHVNVTSSTLYLQTGVGYLSVGTYNYGGIGKFGGVERIKDDLEKFSPGVKLWLTAVPSSDLLAEVGTEMLFNKEVLLYRAFIRNGAVVNTPELWFRGRINEIRLHRMDPERGDHVTMECRTRLKKEAKSSYYTKEDLWLTYSGDTGFNYHAQIPGFRGQWGNLNIEFQRARFAGTHIYGVPLTRLFGL
jgi:hypothetical protein